jgi:hypothetical protein
MLLNVGSDQPAETKGAINMTMCKRLRRERVCVAAISGAEEPEGRAKLHGYMRAMKRGAPVPPVFLMRMGGELHLIHGAAQIAAADELGHVKVDAVVFEPADIREECDAGAWGYDLAAAGEDIWRGLRLRMARADSAAAKVANEPCAVALFPGLTAADRARVSAQLWDAGIQIGPA